MLFSTVLTLFVIPAVYSFMSSNAIKPQKNEETPLELVEA
jgi:Cu/Ag efflux pump CusA